MNKVRPDMHVNDRTYWWSGSSVFYAGHGQRSVCSRFMLLTALVVLPLTGCGGPVGPKTVSVTGKVTYAGKPVKDAAILFAPVDLAKSQPGTATSDSDGRYKAMTNNNLSGLMAGDYKVSVVAYKVPLQNIPPVELAKMGDSNLAVPKKYHDIATSGLTVSVDGKTSKVLDLTLTD